VRTCDQTHYQSQSYVRRLLRLLLKIPLCNENIIAPSMANFHFKCHLAREREKAWRCHPDYSLADISGPRKIVVVVVVAAAAIMALLSNNLDLKRP